MGQTSNANASLFDKSQTNKLEALFLQYYEPNAQKAQLKAEILSIMKEAFDERIKQIDENIQSIKANPKSKPKERAKQQEEILLYESFKHDLDTLLKDYKEHNFHTDKLFLYRFFFAPVFQNGGFDIVQQKICPKSLKIIAIYLILPTRKQIFMCIFMSLH